jgi:hypothetical protein
MSNIRALDPYDVQSFVGARECLTGVSGCS